MALRQYFRAEAHHGDTVRHTAALDPDTTAAIVALAPLGATMYDWKPRYDRKGSLRMGPGRFGSRSRQITPDDPLMPRTARQAASKAATNGWRTTIAAVQDPPAVAMVCRRDRTLVTMAWQDGKFQWAWALTAGDLQPLGYRAACALLESMHT